MEKNIENLEDKLYTAPEIADILGVSLRTIYRYVKSGKLAFETRTRTSHYLFSKDALHSFLYPEDRKPKVKEQKLEQEKDSPKEKSLEKPLQFTPTGAVRPLHERDILKSE